MAERRSVGVEIPKLESGWDKLKAERDELRAFAQEAVDALRYVVEQRTLCKYGECCDANYALSKCGGKARAMLAKSKALLTGQPSTQEARCPKCIGKGHFFVNEIGAHFQCNNCEGTGTINVPPSTQPSERSAE